MAVLLIVEHNNKELKAFTLNAATAASQIDGCLLYTSPSPRDRTRSRMPSSA